jgi:LysM repeat protein
MQKSQSTIIVAVMIMAAIAAVGLYLTWSFLSRRPDLPNDSYQTNVEGLEIVVRMDLAQKVQLVNPPAAQPDLQPADQTTEPAPDQSSQEGQPPPTDTPPPPEPTAVPRPDAVIFVDYVVQPNESMYGMALRLDTSIALMAQEGIAQDNLVPGQTIRLPIGNPEYCPGRRPYAVGEQDTAYSIGHRLNITVEELKAINDLDDNFTVYAGGILCVP